jgi:ribosomal protein L11 methyltransferase
MNDCWWLQLQAAPDEAELAADCLWSLGATAVREEPECLLAGFPDRDAALGAAAALHGRWSCRTGADDGSWRQVWRNWAGPVEAGPLAFCLPGQSTPSGRRRVDLEPGDAFGSGHHASTRQCLEELVEIIPEDRPSVLDVGTGSGILALAAAALGAGPVVGLDTDPGAVAVAAANARHNRLPVRLVAGATGCLAGPFEVTVANLGGLLSPTRLLPELRRLTSRLLVVGGLLDPQASGLGGPGSGFSVAAARSDSGWSCLRLVRDDAAHRRRA